MGIEQANAGGNVMNQFAEIRRAYRTVLPELQAEYENCGRLGDDPYFVKWEMTPIEEAVWADIRMNGLPLFPQVPALKYFLDFACPILQIAIECDGAKWHDPVKDRIRDDALIAAGWTVYRLPGHECNRNIQHLDCDGREVSPELTERFYMTTGAGLVQALLHTEYYGDCHHRNIAWMYRTLAAHRQ